MQKVVEPQMYMVYFAPGFNGSGVWTAWYMWYILHACGTYGTHGIFGTVLKGQMVHMYLNQTCERNHILEKAPGFFFGLIQSENPTTSILMLVFNRWTLSRSSYRHFSSSSCIRAIYHYRTLRPYTLRRCE